MSLPDVQSASTHPQISSSLQSARHPAQRTPSTLIKNPSTQRFGQGLGYDHGSPHPPSSHLAHPTSHSQALKQTTESFDNATDDAHKPVKTISIMGFGASAGRQSSLGVRAPHQNGQGRTRMLELSPANEMKIQQTEEESVQISRPQKNNDLTEGGSLSARERSVRQDPSATQSPFFSHRWQQQGVKPFTPPVGQQTTLLKTSNLKDFPRQVQIISGPPQTPQRAFYPGKQAPLPQALSQTGADYSQEEDGHVQPQTQHQHEQRYQYEQEVQRTSFSHDDQGRQRPAPPQTLSSQRQPKTPGAAQSSQIIQSHPEQLPPTDRRPTRKYYEGVGHQPQVPSTLRNVLQEPSSDQFEGDNEGEYDPNYVETFGESDIDEGVSLPEYSYKDRISSLNGIQQPDMPQPPKSKVAAPPVDGPAVSPGSQGLVDSKRELGPPAKPKPEPPFSYRPDFVKPQTLVKKLDIVGIQKRVLATAPYFSDSMDWDDCRKLFKAQKEANHSLIDRYSQYQKDLQALITVKDEVMRQKVQLTGQYHLAGNDLNKQAQELQVTSRQIGAKRRRMGYSREGSFAA